MFSLLSKITPVWTAALAVVFCLSMTAKTDAAEGDPCDLSGMGDGREISDGGGNLHCIPANAAEGLDKCKEAGWGSFFAPFGNLVPVSCQIPVRRSAEGSQNAGSCGIYAGAGVKIEDPCEEAFGAGFNFPRRIEGVEQRFVYDCPDMMVPDPDYVSGGTQRCVACESPKVANAEGLECVLECEAPKVANGEGTECVLECEAPQVANAERTKCILECEAPKVANDDQTECVCMPDNRALGDACVPSAEDFGDVSQEYLCRAFGGTLQIANNGANRVCSGMDRADTFCIVDSVDAFPCRGLFRHLRSCNLDYERPAENMFFCGPACGPNRVAKGGECECAPGFAERNGVCAAAR